MQLSGRFENLVFEDGRKINLSGKINADYTDANHWHPFVEILLSLENGNDVTINFNRHVLKPNDIVILYPGDLHSINNVAENSFLIIQFPLALLNIITEFNNIMPVLSKNLIIEYDPRNQEHDKLVLLLKSMMDLSLSDRPFREAEIYSRLLLFFVIVGQQVINSQSDLGSDSVSAQYKSAKLMAEACLYISQNCAEDLTLESVARYIGISKSYFSHLFKDYTKMTFIDFLTRERIKKAEPMFLGSQKKIIDIAFECGFTSMSSFNRSFKKIKGISPTEFREVLIERAN